MKTIHIMLLLLTPMLLKAQTQQDALSLATASNLTVSKNDAYYSTEGDQRASWYVSTDPATFQTSILFLDNNRQIIYEEKLLSQYVELTSHNRRILDEMLTQLTSRQLLTHRLKITPMPFVRQGTSPAFDDMTAMEPVRTAPSGPTGILTRVLVVNANSLYTWTKAPAPEKITLHVQDPLGKTIRFHTTKTDQFVDALPISNLSEGSYEVSLYGKTWKKKYQLLVSRDSQKPRYELIHR